MWSLIIALSILPITNGYTGDSGIALHQREIITENKDYTLICSQEPLELGIVLDSSTSITQKNFDTAIKFLQNYLRQLDIGSGPDNVRVSIIIYGDGIYTRNAFNLSTYTTKQQVIDAIGRIVHEQGQYTATGEGIKYMRNVQLADGVVRPGVTKIGLVITDGDSQEPNKTRDQAQFARDSGIVMFAVGVGNQVKDRELNNIAGDSSRVARVDTFDQLNSIIQKLANWTCIKTPKSTTPMQNRPPCGELVPADVYFVFSPADLGTSYTAWTTSFISRTISFENMDVGFRATHSMPEFPPTSVSIRTRNQLAGYTYDHPQTPSKRIIGYGVISGSCPIDAGFNLKRYGNVNDIRKRLKSYDSRKLTSLTKQLALDGFTAESGAREKSAKVAVLFVSGKKSTNKLAEEINKLVRKGVKVFIADPLESTPSIQLPGATTLQGNVLTQAGELVNILCPE